MDDLDPLLSHQVQVVNALSIKFEKVTVITSRVGTFEKRPNVRVINTCWNSRKRFLSLLRFFMIFISFLRMNRNVIIFSHMTEVQSAIICPITRLLKIKHFLWYAHTHKSKYLAWCNLWVTCIITSTPGSCPIKSKKVKYIGQAVDDSVFIFRNLLDLRLENWVHIGRFDNSKNIQSIIKVFSYFQKNNHKMTFTQIGSPSTKIANKYADSIKKSYAHMIESRAVKIELSVPRENLPTILAGYDVFAHSYIGSLDKTLIEATLVGLPVITINSEYVSIFGPWGELENMNLTSEYEALLKIPDIELKEILINRRKLCVMEHSLKNWVNKLSETLI